MRVTPSYNRVSCEKHRLTIVYHARTFGHADFVQYIHKAIDREIRCLKLMFLFFLISSHCDETRKENGKKSKNQPKPTYSIHRNGE